MHVNGFVQDCGISIANALEIPQSCTKPLMYCEEMRKINGLVQDCSNSIAKTLGVITVWR